MKEIGVGDLVRWRPEPGSPWEALTIDGTVVEMHGPEACQRVRMMRVTAVQGALPPTAWRGWSCPQPGPLVGSLVDVTSAPGTVDRLPVPRTPYQPLPAAPEPAFSPGTILCYNAVFHIEPDPPDLAERQAARVAEHQRAEAERMPRPDGFDQRQIDAARAALLAPVPPRYARRQ